MLIPPSISKVHLVLAGLAAALCISSSGVYAVTQTWNPGGAGGGTGNWGDPNWSPGPSWMMGNAAIFGGTAGTVTVGTQTASGLTFNTGGYILSAGTLTLTGTPTFNLTGTTTFTNVALAGSATGITLTGGGTLAISTASSGGTFVWTVTGGSTFSITAGNNLGNAPAGAQVVLDNGTLITTQNGSNTINTRKLQINAAGGTYSDTGGAFTVSGDIANNAGSGKTFTIDTPVTAGATVLAGIVSGSGSLTKTGAGALTLSGGNAYTGTTLISTGTVNANNSSALGNNSAVTIAGNSNTGIVLGANLSVGSLSGGFFSGGTGYGNVQLSTFTLTAGANNTSTGYDGTISGSGGFAKAGSGTMTLSGVNTYTGKTTVNAGILTLNSTGTAISSTGAAGTGANAAAQADNSDVQIVTGGTLLLAKANQIVDTAKMGLSGGKFALAGFSEGTHATAGLGALTLSANSILDFGSTNNTFVHFANSSAPLWSGTLSIYNWSGNLAGGGADQLLFGTNSSSLTTTQLGEISFYSGAGTGFLGTGGFAPDGEIVPVPEPGTIVGALGALGLLAYRNRQRLMVGRKICWRGRGRALGLV